MMWVVLIFATGAVAAHRDPRVNHIPLADVEELRHMGGVKHSRGYHNNATSILSIVEEIHSTVLSPIHLTVTSSVGHVPTVSVYGGSESLLSLSSSTEVSESFSITQTSEGPKSTESVEFAQRSESASSSQTISSGEAPSQPTFETVTESTPVTVEAEPTFETSESFNPATTPTEDGPTVSTESTESSEAAGSSTESYPDSISDAATSTIVQIDEPTQSVEAQAVDSSTGDFVVPSDSQSIDTINANIMIDEQPIVDPIITNKPLYQDPIEAENEHLIDGAEDEEELTDQVAEPQEEFNNISEPLNEAAFPLAHNGTHAGHHNGTRPHHNGTHTHHNGTHAHHNSTNETLASRNTISHLARINNSTSGPHLTIVRGRHAPLNASTVLNGTREATHYNATHLDSSSALPVLNHTLNNTRKAMFNGTHLVPTRVVTNAATHATIRASFNTTHATANTTTQPHNHSTNTTRVGVLAESHTHAEFENDILTNITDTSEPDSDFNPQSTESEGMSSDASSLESARPSSGVDLELGFESMEPVELSGELSSESMKSTGLQSKLHEGQRSAVHTAVLRANSTGAFVEANSATRTAVAEPNNNHNRDFTTSPEVFATSDTRSSFK